MLEADNSQHGSSAVVLKYEFLASAGGLRRWHESSRWYDCLKGHSLKARKEGLEVQVDKWTNIVLRTTNV
ncbi:uncharacterized protein Bfra_000296 [Botrytis fragariae]|uniref:Uncharacterized protein n=1 Tax=Botrytis fragariae TaxID=1964551 RepID=A0A8H6B2V2_9HELO|nr:uncharacterized protein Bfra_000296 [Botrytis fragariae]KAF5878128.1 hypothetical protein Bfra_000296 [Botrytis fragariae]